MKIEASKLARLRGWLDPEWPAFLGCALLVPLAALISGRPDRAQFFLGIAIYLSSLKWLGWACLTRRSDDPVAGLRWPMELLAGLALSGAWFYLRNLLGSVWPASYSLIELRGIFWVLLGAHAVGAAVGGPVVERLRQAAVRSLAWLPFWLAVAIMLWEVSICLETRSGDPLFHAFTAKSYFSHGIFFRGYNGGVPLVYATGFGALNASAIPLSGLDAVQVVNFQHPVWLAIALWAIAGRCGLSFDGPRAILHVAPLVLLAVIPLHNLPPSVNRIVYYYGTARQLSPALMTALALLPGFYVPAGRLRITVLGFVALFCVLTAAMNAACIPFAAVGLGIAVATSLRSSKEGRLRSLILPQALALGACGLLVFSCDYWYQAVLRNDLRPQVTFKTLVPDEPRFSPAAGLDRVTSESLLGFARPPTQMDLPGQDGPPILAACAVGASLAFLWALFRNPGLPVRRGLAWLALSGAGLWLGLKFGIGFMTGGMSREWWDTWQLARYLAFLHVRVEILLVFAVGLSGVLFALTTLHALGGARATGCGVLGFALLASLTAPNDLARLATPLSRGLVVDPAAEQGRISRDDLDLVAWMDGHLPREKGLVGLACVVGWPLDPKASDLLICPYGGAQAVLHYARHENWCFYMHELARPFGFFDYVERIRDDFDARWCLDQGIRYFYVSRNALAFNSGLSEAIRNGTLVPLRESGDSTLYQILPGPTSP